MILNRSQKKQFGKSIEKATTNVLQRLIASELIGPKIVSIPQLSHKIPDAILKCKTLFKKPDTLIFTLKAFLGSKASEEEVWTQLEFLF